MDPAWSSSQKLRRSATPILGMFRSWLVGKGRTTTPLSLGAECCEHSVRCKKREMHIQINTHNSM